MYPIPVSVQGEIYRRGLRKDYSKFCQHVNPDFYMTKFHKYLCDEIQEFLETPSDKIFDILLLAVPPRHGKTFTVTETLPAWVMGNDPKAEVIIASYEGTIAEGFNRRVRDKYSQYCQQIWPEAKPNPNVQGVAWWETEAGGRCRAAGLKAGITGFGANVFILDDPIKNREAADSENIITKIHEEMEPSVQSRIYPGGKLIVIQTRWVENDVIGWIEDNWADNIYKIINLPAQYDEEAALLGPCPLGRKIGDSLMGEHLGDDESKMPQKIMNNNRMVASRKATICKTDGNRTWNALYQGRPTFGVGSLFPESAWQPYVRTEELRNTMEYWGLSLDATFKSTDTSDYVSIQLWGLKGRNAYLWRLINKRLGFVDTIKILKKLYDEHQEISEFVVEDKANGSAIIDVFSYEPDMPPLVPIEPHGGKLSRAQATSNFVCGGNCYVPTDFTSAEDKDVDWDKHDDVSTRDKFIKQHSSFPFAKRDDMVDAQTQQISRLLKMITGDIPMPQRREYKRYVFWHQDMWEDYDQLMTETERNAFIAYHGAPKEWQPGYADYREKE